MMEQKGDREPVLEDTLKTLVRIESQSTKLSELLSDVHVILDKDVHGDQVKKSSLEENQPTVEPNRNLRFDMARISQAVEKTLIECEKSITELKGKLRV